VGKAAVVRLSWTDIAAALMRSGGRA
jgi:hypothetical protein